MGIGSPIHWIIVLIVVVLIFGTKKLRNIGEDLGGAIRGFKEGMKSEEEKAAEKKAQREITSGQTIEGEVKEKTNS